MNPVRSFRVRGAAAVAVLLLTWVHPGVAANPAAVKTLDGLLKAYRMYGLPEPPADAPLVCADLCGRGLNRSLGFLIRPTNAGEPPGLLVRTGDVPFCRGQPKPVEPRPEVLEGVNSDVDLGLAVRCHARGWTDLAVAVLERDSADADQAPLTRLARAAWDYWFFAFGDPETDRAKVARLLKVIWEHRRDDFDVEDRNVLDALESSLVPGRGKPGTIEALIDELIDVTKTDRNSFATETKELHPAYVKLARHGFDAVPALIEHLTDERLTRAYPVSFAHYRDHLTVADIVRHLLESLAGDEVSREWARSKEDRVETEDVEKWWADARKVGEKAYLVEHVLGADVGENLWNRLTLEALTHRYPEELPGVYRRMLKERPRMFGWELGEAITGSRLPKEAKSDLFVEATHCSGTAIRIDATRRLLEIDRPAGLRALRAELDRVPENPDGNLRNRPELPLVSVAMTADEPTAWAALDKTLRRVRVRFRVELLDGMFQFPPPTGARKGYLSLLSGFLDDAGRVTAKTKIRNVVANRLAHYLEMDVRPNGEWTDAQWAKLRDDVKKALAREGIR